MNGDFLSVLNAAVDRGALAVIMAGAITGLWLAPARESPAGKSLLRGWIFVAVLGCGVAATMDLLLRTAALADVAPLSAWSFVPKVLGQSDYGAYWQLRAAVWSAMLLMSVALLRGLGTALQYWGLLFAAAATALLMSVTGHAGEHGIWSLPNLVNWAHLIGISLWGGAIVLFAVVVIPPLLHQPRANHAANSAGRLSSLATVALAVVVASGVYNAWRQMGAVSDLWTTSYGLILLVKLALVAVMMAIGAFNKFRLVPMLQNVATVPAAQPRRDAQAFAGKLLSVLRADSLVYVGVLVAAVLLAMQEPPRHMASAAEREAQSLS